MGTKRAGVSPEPIHHAGRVAAGRADAADTTDTEHGESGATAPVTPIDGRRARAERSREAVVDAILQLLREGNRRPSAAEIAERAGVSLRSVFRHFDDLESLWSVAVERHSDMIAPLFTVTEPAPPAGSDRAPLAARIDALVEQRAVLYEEMRPVRVVAEWQSDQSEALRAGLATSRRILRNQLLHLFDPELAALDTTERRHLVDALELVASFGAWNQLRGDQALSIPRSQAAMRTAVHAVLPVNPKER